MSDLAHLAHIDRVVVRSCTQNHDGTAFAPRFFMHPTEPARWDDLVLAVLLLLIGLPRAVLAIVYDRPIEAEGALSMACVVLALLILLWRNTGRRKS